MRKFLIFALVVMLAVAMVGGAAQAKGKPAGKVKPAQKKNPVVTYVFEGDVDSLDADSVMVSVTGGNKFAKSYAEQLVDFSVNGVTKIVEDNVKAVLSDLDTDDRVLIQLRGPRAAHRASWPPRSSPRAHSPTTPTLTVTALARERRSTTSRVRSPRAT